MECDRRSQLEKRRRRLLRDEAEGDGLPAKPSASPKSARSKARVQSYTEAARADCQPRITDLIPQRSYTLALILLCGLALIAGLETLHAHRMIAARWLTAADLASVDLAGPGSLACWFSSVVLALAAVHAALVFHIRRYKSDDYRGRYGLWLWAVCGCLLASMDCTARLHQPLRAVLVAATGAPVWGDGSAWWISAAGLLFGVIAARVLLDMRGCRGAWLALGSSILCYLLAALLQLELVRVVDPLIRVMLQFGALMLGHLTLWFSFLVYARHVFRDAQGRIARPGKSVSPQAARLRLFTSGAPRAAPPDTQDPVEPGTGPTICAQSLPAADRAQSDSHPTEAPSGTGKPGRAPRLQAGESGDDDELSPAGASSMSKAERRRRRKQSRHQQRAA